MADPCAADFATLNAMDESATVSITSTKRLVPPKPSVLSPEVVESLRRDRDRLRSLVDRDFKEFPTSETIVRSNFVETLSEEAVATANKMAQALKTDLEKKGFVVELVKRPPINALRNGEPYEIPEHLSLTIKPGTAAGPFAKELRRYERYIAKRKASIINGPDAKDLELPVIVDPLAAVIYDTQGFFSKSESYGTGLHLAPATIFNGQDATLEVMRHELRHIKNHFDILSGRPAISRAILIDMQESLGENLGNYENMFTVDEIEGFTANLRNSQAKLGRETEAFRKLNQNPPAEGIKKITKQYKKAVESVQREAESYAKRIENLINISYTNATQARVMLADPGMSTAQLKSRISMHEPHYMPGIVEVAINISKDGKGNGRKLLIHMPADVVARGTEAIRENAVSYLVELDTYLLNQRRELQVRQSDIQRDPLIRVGLPPSSNRSD